MATGKSHASTSLIALFVSIVATVFVGERLFQLTREVALLENQLHAVVEQKREILHKLHKAGIRDLSRIKNYTHHDDGQPCHKFNSEAGEMVEVPFINVPAHFNDLEAAAKLEDEAVTTVGANDDDTRMPPILGQIDLIEDGYIFGWGCEKSKPEMSMEIKFFINEAFVGSIHTHGSVTHPLVNRICDGPANIGTPERNVAFKFRLPTLKEGIYNLRAFVYSKDGKWRKELNSSPQKFVESATMPGISDAVTRKDAIIRARNAQVAALYEQLHSRGIWHKTTNFERVRTFNDTKADNKYLAFVGLISNPNDIHSRDLQRRAWFPKGGEALTALAEEKGIILRFVIGKNDWMTEEEMESIRKEIQEHNDILIVDMRGFEDAAKKTLAFFKAVAFEYDVDFVIKTEKDTVIDLDALVAFLKPLKTKGNLYMGCMKSGEVVRSARQKWHEPEHWKFGDGQGSDRKANYPRHAHRQLLGVSQLVARYLAQNADVMHFYANDDVSVGVWLLGLDVEYIHESRLCCAPRNCKKIGTKVEDRCIGYFEPACSGVCRADTVIESTYKTCIKQ